MFVRAVRCVSNVYILVCLFTSMTSNVMAKRISGHTVRIPDDIWDFMTGYAKEKALRRKDVDPMGISFSDLLRMYIVDNGGKL